MECLHQLLKSRHLFVVNPYMVFRIMGGKRKRKAILLLAYIADVSCLSNRSFYMRTLSLSCLHYFPFLSDLSGTPQGER